MMEGLDARRLRETLAASGMEEHATLLCRSRVRTRLNLAVADTQLLLDLLKQIGISKLGHRQKLANLLQQLATEKIPPPSVAIPTGSMGSFWESICEESSLSAAAGLALRPTVQPKPDQTDEEYEELVAHEEPRTEAPVPIEPDVPAPEASQPGVGSPSVPDLALSSISFEERSEIERAEIYRQCGNDGGGLSEACTLTPSCTCFACM